MTTAWAEFLQRFSSPALDAVAFVITGLGSEIFYTIALPLIYWVWNKRWGYRLGVVFLFSAYLNSVAKLAFHTPRPPASGNVRVIHPETGGGYAFPSGHAQGTTVSWGWMGLEIRRRWFYVVSVLVILAVSLSRIYLNVHWPIDVVGGILIGLFLILVWRLIFRKYDEQKWPLPARAAFSIIAPLALYLLHHTEDVHKILGLLAGMCLGRLLEDVKLGWSESAPWNIQILKVVTGMAGFFALRLGLKAILPEMDIFELFRYFCIGMWVSFGAPYLWKKLGWERTVVRTRL